MQLLTPALEAILVDHFQAGASGFRGRLEVDELLDWTCALSTAAAQTTEYDLTADYTGVLSVPITANTEPSLVFGAIGAYNSNTPGDSAMLGDGIWTPLYTLNEGHQTAGFMVAAGVTNEPMTATYTRGYLSYGGITAIAVGIPTTATGVVQSKAGTFSSGYQTVTLDSAPTPGNGMAMIVIANGTLTPLGDWGDPVARVTWPAASLTAEFDVYLRCVNEGDGTDWGVGGGVNYKAICVIEYEASGTSASTSPVSYQFKRATLDKSLSLEADQLTVELPNEDQSLGWGSNSILPTNSRCRLYEWYGDAANEICSFTGLVDDVLDHRDPLTVTLKARDLFAILLTNFTATAPQGADEDGADRTEDNGVYRNREVSYIVNDILDRVGWPTADRVISDTSYLLAEFIIADGWMYGEAIIGADRLAGLVGYTAWADELGVFHFEPTYAAGSLTDPPDPDYTYTTGINITQLDRDTNQYPLRTRVKVRGPLTTETLTDTWREVWRTTKFRYPVGLWYDPSDSANLRVLDRGTKRLYKLRQSDRVVLSYTYLGGVIAYPLGLSGDPSDSTIYWVLNGPWLWGSGTASSIKKVRKSDNVVLASYTLDTDHWSAIKVSGSYIYVTNLSDEKVYRRSKADGSAVDDFRHTYASVLQSNPSGIMIDGTTISVFWSNGGTTARFLQCEESAPGTVTNVVKTAGTVLHGGEMDTTTHTECYGDSDSLGLVAKFTLVDVGSVTTEVYAEVVDSDLEDELGALAQLEPRIHDTHSGDAAHAYMIRRDTVDIDPIISLAQATETAARRLDLLARREQVLDVGIIGNPALQKTDTIRVVDARTGTSRDWQIDTYESVMDAESGTYVGALALLPVDEASDTPTDSGDAT